MIKFLKRIPWKDVLVTVLVVALGVGAVVGVGAAITNKQKTVSPLVFERGGVDENGEHIKSTQSIYTKDYIECQGLEITPDFEASGTYQVFYYDTNKIFLGATSVMDAHSTVTYKKGADFPYAAYARIVITPEVPKDDDGYVDEDYKVKFYEVTSIASKYTIKVNKQQKNVGSEDYFNSAYKNTGIIIKAGEEGYLEESPSEQGNNYCGVYLEDVNVNSFKVSFEKAPGELAYIFVTKDNRVASQGTFNDKDTDYIISVPDNAVIFNIIYHPSNVPSIHLAG